LEGVGGGKWERGGRGGRRKREVRRVRTWVEIGNG